MSGVTNRVAPDQLKSLAIISGKTAKRSTVDRKGKDIKKKKSHGSLCYQHVYYLQVSKTLATTERRLTEW